jgi:hypothetical protein
VGVPVRRSRGRSDGARDEKGKRAPLMLRHPKRSLLVGVIVVALLSVFGFSLERRLNPSTIEISGTNTSQATEMLKE